MAKEIEVKFLDINVKKIRKILKEMGAKRVHKGLLFRRYVFTLFDNKDGYARIRDEVFRKTMTVKTYEKDSKYANEYEIEIKSSLDEAKSLIESLGLQLKAYQETVREKWTYKGCSELVIDTIPGIPTYIEIECESENIVKEVVEKLGLKFSDGKYGAYDLQYLEYYGIARDDLNLNIRRLSFENIDTDLKDYIQMNEDKLLKVKKEQLKTYRKAKKRIEKKI